MIKTICTTPTQRQNVTAVREVLCKDITISCPYYNLGIGRLCSPDYFSLFCVRLTDNMMCNLAVELAMASTASTVDLENSTIQTREMNIERVTGLRHFILN